MLLFVWGVKCVGSRLCECRYSGVYCRYDFRWFLFYGDEYLIIGLFLFYGWWLSIVLFG